MVEKKLCGINGYFKCLFQKNVCLSVCLTFFERADARGLGLMTLLSYCVFLMPHKLQCTLSIFCVLTPHSGVAFHILIKMFFIAFFRWAVTQNLRDQLTVVQNFQKQLRSTREHYTSGTDFKLWRDERRRL